MKTLQGDSTRPTSSRVKESLFNILHPYISGAAILDLFAGTGNLGIEALSRGAVSAVFVDKNRECADIIQANLHHTKLSEKARVLTGEVSTILSRLSAEHSQFDIIFLDPPYNKNLVEETLNLLLNSGIMKDDGIIIAESDINDVIPKGIGSFELKRSQKYGDSVLSFFVGKI